METRAKILKLADEAIDKGFGSYFCLPNTSWHDIRDGYNAGKRVDNASEAKLIGIGEELTHRIHALGCK